MEQDHQTRQGRTVQVDNRINFDPDAEVPSRGPRSMDDSVTMSDGGDDEFNLIVESPDVDQISEEEVKSTDDKCDEENILQDDAAQTPGHKWKARTNFTADSPYYSSFCDAEVNNLKVLCDTLYDISSKTRTFCKTGFLMSDASRRLSLACKLRTDDGNDSGDDDLAAAERAEQIITIKRQAIGEEMTDILQHLGDVLEQTATAQFSMCRALEEHWHRRWKPSPSWKQKPRQCSNKKPKKPLNLQNNYMPNI